MQLFPHGFINILPPSAGSAHLDTVASRAAPAAVPGANPPAATKRSTSASQPQPDFDEAAHVGAAGVVGRRGLRRHRHRDRVQRGAVRGGDGGPRAGGGGVQGLAGARGERRRGLDAGLGGQRGREGREESEIERRQEDGRQREEDRVVVIIVAIACGEKRRPVFVWRRREALLVWVFFSSSFFFFFGPHRVHGVVWAVEIRRKTSSPSPLPQVNGDNAFKLSFPSSRRVDDINSHSRPRAHDRKRQGRTRNGTRSESISNNEKSLSLLSTTTKPASDAARWGGSRHTQLPFLALARSERR